MMMNVFFFFFKQPTVNFPFRLIMIYIIFKSVFSNKTFSLTRGNSKEKWLLCAVVAELVQGIL